MDLAWLQEWFLRFQHSQWKKWHSLEVYLLRLYNHRNNNSNNNKKMQLVLVLALVPTPSHSSLLNY
jgi:hypothetical protein